MKKVLTIICLAALLLGITATTVFAAGRYQGQNFTDENKDGICDNYNSENSSGICNRADSTKPANGNGVCNLSGKGNGKGQNFTDADKDGICDNYNSENSCGNCANKGLGCRNGRR
ncbi:MAG: hypothetical protein PUA85_06195 [Oscillospiraceae bacterium]|nr:hypothetical protein [Oscillospiraceae bacterium]